mgnify:CR=1 FL=1
MAGTMGYGAGTGSLDAMIDMARQDEPDESFNVATHLMTLHLDRI